MLYSMIGSLPFIDTDEATFSIEIAPVSGATGDPVISSI